MTEELYEEVAEIIEEALAVEVNSTDDNLEADYGADDLDRVEIMIALEEFYNIEFADDEPERWITVHDVIRSVERQL
jgi:acyl carrier protein